MDNKSNKSKGEIIIVAPHPDDELIGCYNVLRNQDWSTAVLYSGSTEPARREEAMKVKEYFPSVKAQMFHDVIPPPFLNLRNRFYFPDPIYEVHPDHRRWGQIGESMARQGYDVVFYVINMNAPYIFRQEAREDKKKALNELYPSQKDLWRYDGKYYLFEGYCKWIF